MSKTHIQAVEYMKGFEKCEKRKIGVVKNQLRTALGIVKSKAAAIQYEARIAELQAAGAEVGDFGHSRKLFPDMLKAFCAHIDQRTAAYLSSPVPNTGMLPHFFVTADKSTNHRVTNQVTMVCPMVNGDRRAIPLDAKQVHTNSDGTGGTGADLPKQYSMI